MSYSLNTSVVDDIDADEGAEMILNALEKAKANGKPVKCKFRWFHPSYGNGELNFTGKAGANNASKAKREVTEMFSISSEEASEFSVELVSERLITKKTIRH